MTKTTLNRTLIFSAFWLYCSAALALEPLLFIEHLTFDGSSRIASGSAHTITAVTASPQGGMTFRYAIRAQADAPPVFSFRDCKNLEYNDVVNSLMSFESETFEQGKLLRRVQLIRSEAPVDSGSHQYVVEIRKFHQSRVANRTGGRVDRFATRVVYTEVPSLASQYSFTADHPLYDLTVLMHQLRTMDIALMTEGHQDFNSLLFENGSIASMHLEVGPSRERSVSLDRTDQAGAHEHTEESAMVRTVSVFADQLLYGSGEGIRWDRPILKAELREDGLHLPTQLEVRIGSQKAKPRLKKVSYALDQVLPEACWLGNIGVPEFAPRGHESLFK